MLNAVPDQRLISGIIESNFKVIRMKKNRLNKIFEWTIKEKMTLKQADQKSVANKQTDIFSGW